MSPRRAGRRAGRRVARRTTKRIMRRRFRRRIVVGGMILLAAGGAATAIKMSKDDAKKIEQETGVSVEELTEDELAAAMKKLNIQSIELDENDKATIAKETGQESKDTQASAPEKQNDQPSYLNELEQLKKLLDQGVITQEEFETKKAQLLGL